MLAANNVKVVGVGFEELGVQEFIDARYLDGGKYTLLKSFMIILDCLKLGVNP